VANVILAGTAEQRTGWPRLRVSGSVISTPLLPGGLRQVTMSARGLAVQRAREGSGVPLTGTRGSLLRGTTERRFRWGATVQQTASAMGLSGQPPVNQVVGGVDPSEPLRINPRHAQVVMSWFTTGEEALTRLCRWHAPDAPGVDWLLADTFVLTYASGGVSYGVCPGDWETPEPFAFITRPTGERHRQSAAHLRSAKALLAYFRAHA